MRTTSVSRYHLNSLFSALCDRLTSVFAVTGNPVPVYFHADFFGMYFGRLQRCFPAETSTIHLLLCQVTGLDMPFGLLDQHAYYS